MKERLSAIGTAHTEWLSALGFYRDELDIMKNRLTEVGAKNTAKEAMAQLEHFENQIKLQQDKIDTLEHDIKVNLAAVTTQAQENHAGFIDANLLDAHKKQEGEFAVMEKIIADLRHEFNRFAATWM